MVNQDNQEPHTNKYQDQDWNSLIGHYKNIMRVILSRLRGKKRGQARKVMKVV